VRILRFLEDALVKLLNGALTRDTTLTERVLFFSFGDGSFDSLAIGISIIETSLDSSLRSCGWVEAMRDYQRSCSVSQDKSESRRRLTFS
jgi:hypothetical protein